MGSCCSSSINQEILIKNETQESLQLITFQAVILALYALANHQPHLYNFTDFWAVANVKVIGQCQLWGNEKQI